MGAEGTSGDRRPDQRWFCAVVFLSALLSSLSAESVDLVWMRDGQRHDGEVLAEDGAGIRLRLKEGGEMLLDAALVRRIDYGDGRDWGRIAAHLHGERWEQALALLDLPGASGEPGRPRVYAVHARCLRESGQSAQALAVLAMALGRYQGWSAMLFESWLPRADLPGADDLRKQLNQQLDVLTPGSAPVLALWAWELASMAGDGARAQQVAMRHRLDTDARLASIRRLHRAAEALQQGRPAAAATLLEEVGSSWPRRSRRVRAALAAAGGDHDGAALHYLHLGLDEELDRDSRSEALVAAVTALQAAGRSDEVIAVLVPLRLRGEQHPDYLRALAIRGAPAVQPSLLLEAP